jgi:hypothetical protein
VFLGWDLNWLEHAVPHLVLTVLPIVLASVTVTVSVVSESESWDGGKVVWRRASVGSRLGRRRRPSFREELRDGTGPGSAGVSTLAGRQRCAGV